MKQILTILFLVISLASCAQKKTTGKELINKVCDDYMRLFAEGKTGEAGKLLQQNTVIDASAIQSLEEKIEQQKSNYFPSYGKIISSEFVIEKNIKDFLLKRIYILRFEKYYLKFEFTLYKTNDGWTITNFIYNDDLTGLL